MLFLNHYRLRDNLQAFQINPLHLHPYIRLYHLLIFILSSIFEPYLLLVILFSFSFFFGASFLPNNHHRFPLLHLFIHPILQIRPFNTHFLHLHLLLLHLLHLILLLLHHLRHLHLIIMHLSGPLQNLLGRFYRFEFSFVVVVVGYCYYFNLALLLLPQSHRHLILLAFAFDLKFLLVLGFGPFIWLFFFFF
jgi:hypothetical protein